MNKGTNEGTKEEKNLVSEINKGKYDNFIKENFTHYNNIYCIHTTKNKFSRISKKFVKPKSDAFFVQFNKAINLADYEYYLEEKDLDKFNTNQIEYAILKNSGISIKRPDSSKYQIHKFTPVSFIKIFNDSYLGAGAMIYSKNEKDFKHNKQIIEAWNLKEEQFFLFFEKKLGKTECSVFNKDFLKEINQKCTSDIKKKINEDKNIKQTIFTGKNDFDEPFGATFSFIYNKLEKFKYIDFIVTQGSNRKGNPTIVIKPKS